MSKNKIMIILLSLLSLAIISLYTTFAYQENNIIQEKSLSDYNFTYSLQDNINKEISVNSKEEKFIDIELTNTYKENVKYGMYYYVTNFEKLPNNVIITKAKESPSKLSEIIKPKDTKIVTIKITNNSEYAINLIVGALVGFENGSIEDLVTDKINLIK